MANELPPELSDLVVLQRQTLATIDRITQAVTAPRRVVVERDARGAIIGATSQVVDGPDEDDFSEPTRRLLP